MKPSLLRSFVNASSLPVTIWPLGGLAIAAYRQGSDFDFAITAISIPLMFGTYHAITRALGVPSSARAMFAAGAVLGLMLASIGTFILHIPEQVYGLEGNRRFIALLGGPLFYGAVWLLALRPLERGLKDA